MLRKLPSKTRYYKSIVYTHVPRFKNIRLSGSLQDLVIYLSGADPEFGKEARPRVWGTKVPWWESRDKTPERSLGTLFPEADDCLVLYIGLLQWRTLKESKIIFYQLIVLYSDGISETSSSELKGPPPGFATVFDYSHTGKIHYIPLFLTVFMPPHHTYTTVLRPFFLGPPGWAGARRELLDFMVQGKINRGRHTDQPAGGHSVRTKQCPPPSPSHFLQAGCHCCRPTNSVKALKATSAFGLERRR